MQLIGNILLAIAAIALFYLLWPQLGFNKAPGGDAGVGYYYVQFVITALFTICMLLILIIIGTMGGFATFGANSTNRFLIVTGAVILICTNIWVVDHANVGGWNIAKPIKIIIRCIPLLLLLLLLLADFVFLNQKAIASPAIIKLTSHGLIYISIACLLVVFICNQVQRQQDIKSFYKDNPNGLDDNEQRIIKQIDTCDVSKDMVFILVFTDENQHKIIREKAVAKVKTNANWQQELIVRLQNDWAPEPFTFLASNKVDNPAIFLEPVNKGILVHAKLVREKIKDYAPTNADFFWWESRTLLRAVDRFDNMGMDYLPAMKELRRAFEPPAGYDKIDFNITPYLDKWIKKHEK